MGKKSQETAEERQARKAAVKEAKQSKRLQKQGLVENAGQKPCTLCLRPRDLLIRCTIESGGAWQMLCGKCWMQVCTRGGRAPGAD